MVDYVRVLADLRAQAARIEQERLDVKAAIASIQRLVAAAPDAHHLPSAAPVTAAALKDLPLPEAIVLCLRDLRQPQKKSQLKAALLARGVPKTKDYGAKVYNALYRGKGERFFQDKEGRWGLSEWHKQPAGSARPRK